MKRFIFIAVIFTFWLPLSANSLKTINGSVSKLKDKVSIVYRIGDYVVARGSEKHIKPYVGKQVSVQCAVRGNRIFKIKSVTLSKMKTVSAPTLNTLHLLYEDDPKQTIQNYRGKVFNYKFKATGIMVYNAEEYVIFLEKTKGKLIVKKDNFPEKTIKALWNFKHSARAKMNRLQTKQSQAKSIMISFTGSWVGNVLDSFIFRVQE